VTRIPSLGGPTFAAVSLVAKVGHVAQDARNHLGDRRCAMCVKITDLINRLHSNSKRMADQLSSKDDEDVMR
jgi:hypothetical protein